MENVGRSSEVEQIMAIINGFEEKGKALGKKTVAKEMLKEGLSSNLIAKVTGLDSLEIINLMEVPISYKEKGKELAKKEAAIELLKEGLELELISKVTQIEIKEIEKIKKQL